MTWDPTYEEEMNRGDNSNNNGSSSRPMGSVVRKREGNSKPNNPRKTSHQNFIYKNRYKNIKY